MSKQLVAVFTAAIVMTACKQEAVKTTLPTVQSERPPDPSKSAVLALLEKNGAGDVSNSSVPAFKRWLSKRGALAEQVVKICEPIEANAPVSWGDSAEWRACSAAHQTSAELARAKAWKFVPPVADKRGW